MNPRRTSDKDTAGDLSATQRAIVLTVAQETATATVQQTMTALGIDMSSPPAMIQAQVDFAHLRRSRKWSEKIMIAARIAIVTGGLGFAIKLAWSGLRVKLGGGQ